MCKPMLRSSSKRPTKPRRTGGKPSPATAMTAPEWVQWMEVAEHVLAGTSAITCPNCGSTEVASRFVGGGESRLGYGAVWCNACLHGVWLSRLTIPLGIPMVAIDSDPASIDIPRFKQVTPLDE